MTEPTSASRDRDGNLAQHEPLSEPVVVGDPPPLVQPEDSMVGDFILLACSPRWPVRLGAR